MQEMPICSILKEDDTGHGQNLLSCEKQSSQNMLRCKNSFFALLRLAIVGRCLDHLYYVDTWNSAPRTTEQCLMRHPTSREGTWRQRLATCWHLCSSPRPLSILLLHLGGWPCGLPHLGSLAISFQMGWADGRSWQEMWGGRRERWGFLPHSFLSSL